MLKRTSHGLLFYVLKKYHCVCPPVLTSFCNSKWYSLSLTFVAAARFPDSKRLSKTSV